MKAVLLFSWALVTVVIGPDSIPLDQKLRMIFNDIDANNDQHFTKTELYVYFERFRHNPHLDFIECFHFQHDWHHLYKDPAHVGAGMCYDHFDHDGDEFLDQRDMDVFYPKLDINPTDEVVDYDEFDVYFRKMYNDLGVHSR